MQQDTTSPNNELVSISAAARAIGVNPSTLSRQVRAGLVRSHDGKVLISGVLEDRAANLKWQGTRSVKPAVGPHRPAAADLLHPPEFEPHAPKSEPHATHATAGAVCDLDTALRRLLGDVAAEVGCDPTALAAAISGALARQIKVGGSRNASVTLRHAVTALAAVLAELR